MTQLPFGNTQIESKTLLQQIESEEAIEQLESAGLEDASRRIEAFVTAVPALLSWLQTSGRQYPWRYTIDPWRVYISEILLQRTRGDAVVEIYDKFFGRFPDPSSLDVATESEIRNTVDSLGFGNQRTRTLQDVADLLVSEHGGEVPASPEELKRPWRVGEYSANATLLFAFGEPRPLVDANIARIIERYLGYEMPDQPHKDTDIYALLDSLTPSEPDTARAFYFALIDHGAKICTSSSPSCSGCPVEYGCQYWHS